MAQSKMVAAAFVVLAILVLCEAGRPTLSQSEAPATHAVAKADAKAAHLSLLVAIAEPCQPRDIHIDQGPIPGAAIPTWQVQIMNVCTNPQCLISDVIVQCGAFHSGTLVNPHSFRRLDEKAGTCIVNDGKGMTNAQTITFQYGDTFQALTFKSAKVTCS